MIIMRMQSIWAMSQNLEPSKSLTLDRHSRPKNCFIKARASIRSTQSTGGQKHDMSGSKRPQLSFQFQVGHKTWNGREKKAVTRIQLQLSAENMPVRHEIWQLTWQLKISSVQWIFGVSQNRQSWWVQGRLSEDCASALPQPLPVQRCYRLGEKNLRLTSPTFFSS